MFLGMSPEFLITSLIVVLAPGTGVLYTLATALSDGRRASTAAAFGCTLGILPHITACILGLAALLHTSAIAFQVFKFVGLAYLLYLAWETWRETGALSFQSRPTGDRRTAQIVVRGFLINILNPKLSLFFLAFLPQFVAADAASPTLQMIVLSAVFMLMTFAVFTLYGLFAAQLRTRIVGSDAAMAWLRRSFAAAFAFLGLKLAFAER